MPRKEEELLNARLLEGLLKLSEREHAKLDIDILTVIANKPVNYTGMKKYTLYELQAIAGNYARIRRVDIKESDISNSIRRIQALFAASRIDIITLEGLQLAPSKGAAREANSMKSWKTSCVA
ncbi:hypothetical protein NTE_00875 [Candidatus Nitrososphaera evergladensis SR1]|uniref:Uncharacterized protein n=1 Tax=Candidatus Nitrososphaera evergladensis SR1 TaxID=1459636 RepID=A0A075MN48_9ARCH|nr:hypothetical protein [Candidatus Nitrososphaera evergladensis]AIF82951.1 hypothetical protein NTE_00875 [Candidatus Nitrososphaera evergladensis SR1]